MIKSFSKIIILFCLLFVFSICLTAQTKSRPRVSNSPITTLNGAYAGTSTPNLNPFGGTISFDTYAFYFRQNGTYTSKLGEPNWQTRVDGTYRISGNKVVIQSKSVGDKPEEIEIKDNGSLYYRYSYLSKLSVMNNIRAVILENKSATSAGNYTGSLAYVGNISNTLFNFDGKGNFTNSRESSTLISSANVGGGGSQASGGVGTYTLKDGLLTLSYQDGTVVKKSFFYTEDDGDGTALINGNFYFEPDESKNQNNKTAIKSPPKTTTNPAITTLNGAYAGSSLPLIMPGGGSFSTAYRYYFRPNGTYTTELGEPDWQTRVDGTYKISNNQMTLFPKEIGERPFAMDIEEEGRSLVYGGNTLFKLNVMNSIPAVVVQNRGGTSSGGIGTDSIFVGVSFSGIYNFDGKGRFSNNASSASVISGANVGGGSSNESGGSGTYTIKDSLLTLKYDDGKVVKKSFFYVEFSHGGTALIDGSLYYEPDEPKNETSVKNESDDPNNAIIAEPTTTDKKAADIVITGSRILKLANIAHGGDKLDSLKTISLTGKAVGFELTILVDATNQKVRNEFRKNGKLMLVEQLDGENSWQWGDNLKSPLTFQKRKELKKSLTTGLFALQSNAIKSEAIQTADPNLKGNLKSILVLVDGEKYGMIFDDKNRLVAELTSEDGILQTTYSEDYRNVNGIMIPFKSKITLGEKTVEVKYSTIEVNPTFSEGVWSVPN